MAFNLFQFNTCIQSLASPFDNSFSLYNMSNGHTVTYSVTSSGPTVVDKTNYGQPSSKKELHFYDVTTTTLEFCFTKKISHLIQKYNLNATVERLNIGTDDHIFVRMQSNLPVLHSLNTFTGLGRTIASLYGYRVREWLFIEEKILLAMVVEITAYWELTEANARSTVNSRDLVQSKCSADQQGIKVQFRLTQNNLVFFFIGYITNLEHCTMRRLEAAEASLIPKWKYRMISIRLQT